MAEKFGERPSLRWPQSLRHLVDVIGHNVAIDRLRKRSPGSLDEMKDPEDGAPFQPEASGPSPFDLA